MEAVETYRIKIRCPGGLQIREAFLLAKLARDHRAQIMLDHDGFQAEAKSLMSILWLGVRSNGVVTLTIAGEDAARARASVEDLFVTPGSAVFVREEIPGLDPDLEPAAGEAEG